MNLTTSSSRATEKLTLSPDVSQLQGARTEGLDGQNPMDLQKALQDARLRRQEDQASLEKQQQKQAATLRMIQSNEVVEISKQKQAALDIARALGLSSTQCKALLKKTSTGDLAQILQKQTPETLAKALSESKAQALFQKITSGLNSNDPLATLGISVSAIAALLPDVTSATADENTSANFAKAVGEAMGMIQQLIGKSAESAALLAKFEEAFQALKVLETTNTLKAMQAEQAHYDHQKTKMDVLGVFKKILGAIIAALLAAIGAATGNTGLIAVAVFIVVATFVPKALDTICEGFARDVLQLHGKAAEAVALIMRIIIAVLLTVASGGAGGASAIGSALSGIGTFAGSFMMAGGAENIANLTVDAEHNCDIYSNKATDAEQEQASRDAQIGSYVLMAIGFVCMAGGGLVSLAGKGADASAAVEKTVNNVQAPSSANATTEVADTSMANARELDNEIAQTESKTSTDQSNTETQERYRRQVLRIVRHGFVATTAADGTVSIEIGKVMLTMAGIIKNLITTQAFLSLSETSLQTSTKEMKRDETSDQATTSQSIKDMKNISLDESIAFKHQIVGATAV